MDWRIKATLQKVLSLSRIGDKLNHIPVLFNKNYHLHVVAYQFHECLRKYSYTNLNLQKKNVALEIGTGYSLISPLVLYLLGFQKILTVDIDRDISFKTFRKQITFLNNSLYIDQLVDQGNFSKQQVEERIRTLMHCSSIDEVLSVCNIKYIAPYNLEAIEKEENCYDYICSQVVFEHITPEFLELLFAKFSGWLKKGGVTVHTVNFIDHFTNPGFFQDKKISEFNFLRFSDSYWRFWSGNAIAYTNRLSYLYYQHLFEANDLEVLEFIGENYRPRKELDLSKIHSDVLRKYAAEPELKLLTAYQRGTFVVKN